MTECVQRLRTRLAVRFAVSVVTADGPGQQRMQHVVLGHLLADLAKHVLALAPELVFVRLALEVLADLEVVGGDAVLEEAGVDEVPQRLGEVERHPALVLVDPHDAVAEVLVLADDVGVGVVDFVVRVLPHVGGGGVVPLPGRGVDLVVAHPVPLAVHDVVADLHVLDDLGDREPDRACQPCRRKQREQQYGAAAQFELALKVDDVADVVGVALAAAVEDLLADGVEFAAQVLDVLVAEVRDRVRVLGVAMWSCRYPLRGRYRRRPLLRTHRFGSARRHRARRW